MRALASLTALLLTSCWLPAGCGDRDATGEGTDRATRPGGGSSHPVDPVWRDLLGESARAELDIAGPFIDLGTADQHKYTRGGWATGWRALERDRDGTSHARIAGTGARLFVLAHRRSRVIVLRARARARDQRLDVYWDGVRLHRTDGDPRASIAQSWHVVRFAIPERLAGPGRHQIHLVPPSSLTGTENGPETESQSSRRDDARDGPLDLDWLWIATRPRSAPPADVVRVGPLRLGGQVHRALLAPGPRGYSFYLHVPERGQLAFAFGSDQQVEFTVVAQTAGGVSHTLFQRKNAPGRWSRATVDLGRFSGQAIRLELATEGPRGRAGWGDPVIRGAPAVSPGLDPAPGSAMSPGSGPESRGKKPKNLVLVVHDTSRADLFARFRRSGAGEVETPHFDRLAATATAFTTAYNNESWTRPSTISILTGLYPETHGAMYARSVLPEEVELLSEFLGRNGFRAAGFVANPVLRAEFGLDQGWEYYRTYGRDANRGARVYGDAIRWLRRHHQRGRFFLYVHSHDTHTPYRPDRRYSARYHPESYSGFIGKAFDSNEQYAVDKGLVAVSERDMAWIRALYHGEATYQDEHLGRLIAQLEGLGILDDTLIVITNDHGEEFREHGGMGHGRTLYDEQLRAPLIMRHPGKFPAGARISDIVEHVDVAPTIVEALGLPPLPDADGLSLLPLLAGRDDQARPRHAVAALRHHQRSIRVGRWKLIVDADTARRPRTGRPRDWLALHDLAGDPAEGRDLRASHVIAGRLCEIYLGEALASPAKRHRRAGVVARPRFRSSLLETDDKIRRELEALGYIGNGNDGFDDTADDRPEDGSDDRPEDRDEDRRDH